MDGMEGLFSRTLPALVLSVTTAGCALLAGLSGDYGAPAIDAAVAIDAASDVTDAFGNQTSTDAPVDTTEAGVDAGPCGPSLHGAGMVSVTTAPGKTFCIDATEVTKAHYLAFVESGASGNVAPAGECQWNLVTVPGAAGECAGYALTGTEMQLPIACVDWCDAYAFCAWAGKRLCGSVAGGPLLVADQQDPSKDQWYAACTGGDTKRTFPYGSLHQGGICVEATSGPAIVTANPLCVGAPAGLFDLSGNVSEWLDSCDLAGAVQDNKCDVRGGDYTAPLADKSLTCAPSHNEPRSHASLKVGFRCCRD
jgi:formylglycine-generating enzyme required for sulfatase activity